MVSSGRAGNVLHLGASRTDQVTSPMSTPIERQRAYHAQTALQYDDMHMEPEHLLALHLLAGFIELNGIRSVLDVGAGTGRAMGWLKRRFPNLVVKGVEPVDQLREQGYAKGILLEDLVSGDGYALPFDAGRFDLVCEFAVLHQVEHPDRVVREMSRVASRMVCISDCNFMGQGPAWLRIVKFMSYVVGLWPAAYWIKPRGKRYAYSEGDGVAYSYSVYQSLSDLRQRWNDIRVIRTSPGSDVPLNTMISSAQVLAVAAGPRNQSRV